VTDAEYDDLVKKIEALKQQKAQAAGALNELLRQLKKEFGLSTIKEAKTKLVELGAKAARLERKADRRYKFLLKRWKDILG
jgi:hypothetical protein